MIKATKRQLAARFVEALGSRPLNDLAQGLVAASLEAGWSVRDLPALVAAVEHELNRRYGAVEVQLTTAHELPEATLKALADTIAKQAGATQHSYVHTVDPAVLGGYEASADGVAVRDSIRFNLNNSGVYHG